METVKITILEVIEMLSTNFTEKLLDLQEVNITNVIHEEDLMKIFIVSMSYVREVKRRKPNNHVGLRRYFIYSHSSHGCFSSVSRAVFS